MEAKIILLVEDDELDVISVKRSLKKLNIPHHLFVAFNGKEALALLTDAAAPITPDVILLDLNMPKMNGIEFLKVLRKKEAFKSIKVFVMTTSSETVDRDATAALNVAGYILKPLNVHEQNRTDSMDAFVEFHLRRILTEK
ncbi:MAG TPA: response regulator [Flavobacteriales bacterium]|nr:response regulator [Flavobacteriales bacterium]